MGALESCFPDGCSSTYPAAPQAIRTLLDPKDHFAASREIDGPLAGDCLAAYCILGGQPKRIADAARILRSLQDGSALGKAIGQDSNQVVDNNSGISGLLKNMVQMGAARDPNAEVQAMDRSLGCVLGNCVGDALGAPLEFLGVRYGKRELKGMQDRNIWTKPGYNKFHVKPGQWTDDFAMGLCIADSLLCCNGYDGIDLRQRFFLWKTHGYNNAFGRDPTRIRRTSIGLGGNISMSIEEWEYNPQRKPDTSEGDEYTNGNGSVMRNGAIPVWFRQDLKAGMTAAYGQSKATHQGEEAAECCRLLTFICVQLLAGAGRKLLNDLSGFKSSLYTVTCLAAAKPEERCKENAYPVFGDMADRCWTWRSKDYRYSTTRAMRQPGYVGSYCMDCLSMALHCVYSTENFEDAALKAANLCGDADSVCAVTCQIAGALYGASAIPSHWVDEVERWDGGSIVARALMLHQHEALPREEALSDGACASAGTLGTAHEGPV